MSLGIETFLKPVFPLLPESRVSEKRKRVMVLVTLWGWRDCWSIPPGEADTEAKAETLKTKFCSFTQTPHLGTMVLGHSMVLGREPGFPVHTLPSRIATLGVCLWGRWVWRLWKQFQEFPATQNPSGQGSSSTLVFKSELYKEDRNRTVLARIPPGKMHLSALTLFLAPITISLEIFWSLSPLSSLSSRWAGIAYFFFYLELSVTIEKSTNILELSGVLSPHSRYTKSPSHQGPTSWSGRNATSHTWGPRTCSFYSKTSPGSVRTHNQGATPFYMVHLLLSGVETETQRVSFRAWSLFIEVPGIWCTSVSGKSITYHQPQFSLRKGLSIPNCPSQNPTMVYNDILINEMVTKYESMGNFHSVNDLQNYRASWAVDVAQW